ncbi:MAG: DNA-directed RNA polymerase subunit omega [Tissierellia bacterium]|nr:DNA-directed RNA polymerase subunit omega [Tissierellia bacterium]
MYIPSLNELAKVGDSRYTLAVLTAKRSRQIIEGSKPLIKTNSTKPVSIALEEIVSQKVTYIRNSGKDIK